MWFRRWRKRFGRRALIRNAWYRRKAGMVARLGIGLGKRRLIQYRARTAENSKKRMRYPGVGRKIGEAIGEFGGSFVPGMSGAGRAIGGVVGDGAQSLIKKVTGFGDYQVKKNAMVFNEDAVPEFSNSERCTIITHREFVADIISSTNFNPTTFRINPAIITSFPWLANIAENYEQYVVQGMLYEFKTTSATAIGSTNTGLGTVVMATQYNSLAPDFTNKQQMENYEFSQSTIPCASALHPIECDPMQTQCGGIFNIYNPSDTSGDTRLYDIGRFTIATVGMQAAGAVIGELWVSYKICFLKPRIQGLSNITDLWTFKAFTVNDPIGVNAQSITAGGLNSGMTYLGPCDGSGNQRIYIKASFVGVLQVTITWTNMTFTSCSITFPKLTATVGCSDATETVSTVNGSIQSQFTTGTANNPSRFTTVIFIKCNGGAVNGGDPYFVFGGFLTTGTFAPSSNYNYMIINSLNDEYLSALDV